MNTSVIDKSVTAGDYEKGAKRPFLLGWYAPNGIVGNNRMLPDPGTYWTPDRDKALAATVHYESFWSASIYTAISRIASKEWRVRGPESSQRAARELLMEGVGRGGWGGFLSRHLRDYLLADNGAFIEIVRASNARGSRVVGLAHLPSSRCFRTRDPERPVIYRDLKGREHTLRDYQVISIADMPLPDDATGGLGLCAASRAYEAIYRTWIITQYITEKISGQRPLSLNFVSNVSEEQTQMAIETAKNARASEGMALYMGSVVIPSIDPSQGVTMETIELASLPDGFDSEKEYRRAALIYANAIGLDPQDLDPQLLASRALGTGAQARVIDDKASGKGIAAWENAFAHAINEHVVPGRVVFGFEENDYRDNLQKIAVDSQQLAQITALGTSGLITLEQAMQLAIDKSLIPASFAATPDLTEDGESGSNQKPAAPQKAKPTQGTPFPGSPQDQAVQAQMAAEQQMQMMQEEAKLKPPPASKNPAARSQTSERGLGTRDKPSPKTAKMYGGYAVLEETPESIQFSGD